jgi:hypothetical protein
MQAMSTKSQLSLPNDVSALRIGGVGACMITGYPHESAGMFELACGLIERSLSRAVQSKIVSLGGFPAPCAEKYLKKRLFDFDSEYVIIQFGATDAQCPIRAGSRPTAHSSSHGASKAIAVVAQSTGSYHGKPATSFSSLRWELASVIGQLRQIEPITPLSSYIAAIERMVGDCLSARSKPVVLSPFVYGSRYTSRKARPYVDALRELSSRTPGMIFVDCFSLLSALPKVRILQHDGFHLSRLGQDMIGEAIGKAIIEDVQRAGSIGRTQFGLLPSART